MKFLISVIDPAGRAVGTGPRAFSMGMALTIGVFRRFVAVKFGSDTCAYFTQLSDAGGFGARFSC